MLWMKKSPAIVVLWSMAASALLAGAVVMAVQSTPTSGTRREPQFENDQVRVWKSIIMPNQPLALHRHDHGRTIIALKGGTLDVVDGSGNTIKQMTWETGKAYWLDVDSPGEQHGDLNKGTAPIEVIVVEMR